MDVEVVQALALSFSCYSSVLPINYLGLPLGWKSPPETLLGSFDKVESKVGCVVGSPSI